MKKLLSIVAIGALLSSGVQATTIDVTAVVDPFATVQIADAFSALDYTNNTNKFNQKTIDQVDDLLLNSVTTGIKQIIVNEPLYLQTNVDASTVKISLDSAVLASTSNTLATADNIELAYYYTTGTVTEATTTMGAGTPTQLTTTGTTLDGETQTGQLTIQALTSEFQPAGTYIGAVTVTISIS